MCLYSLTLSIHEFFLIATTVSLININTHFRDLIHRQTDRQGATQGHVNTLNY